MSDLIVFILCLLCFVVGFVFNETLRQRADDKHKIPFDEGIK